MSDSEQFDGVHVPLVTPFADGEFDEAALRAVVDHVVEGGVDGLVPCGTTGEFASLEDGEFERVIETTVDRAPADVPVLAGAADTTVPGTLDRIDRAAAAGADAALVTLPYFHTANDPAGNVAFLEAVADDAALPVYLYNIPACTGAPIDVETVADLAGHDRVRGLKDSSGDFNYFTDLVRETPADFRLFQGFDSYLVPGLVFGGTGGINALANVVPEAFAAAYEAVAEGDLATARDIGREQISPLFGRCIDHGFAPATKAALAERGVLDSAAVRPPLVEVDEEARAELGDLVAAVRRAHE